MMRLLLVFLFFTVGPLPQVPVYAEEGIVMIITGTVKDSATNKPIAGAIVSSDIDVSPIQSSREGAFKFIVMSSKPVMLRVIKEGYKPFEKLLKPQDKINLAIRLEPQEEEITITFSSFRKNAYISGRVAGLPPNEYSEYKVLVYVLTDKWYIHPWAVNAPGRGYATINDDGTWRIGTVWRGYQAYSVAFVLTEKDTYSPSVVRTIADDPDQDLLARVPHRASLIIEAPPGI